MRSKGKRCSSSLSDLYDICDCIKKGRYSCPSLPSVTSVESDVAYLNGTLLNCSKPPLLLPETTPEKSYTFTLDTTKLVIKGQQNNTRTLEETESSLGCEDQMDFMNKKLKMAYPKTSKSEERQMDNVKFENEMQKSNFIELQNTHENSPETKMVQTRFRKHQGNLSQLKPPDSLSKDQSLQIKELHSLKEIFPKKNNASENSSKTSTKIIDKSICNAGKQATGSDDGKSQTVITQMDQTELPHYSLRINPKNVNNDFCLCNRLTLFATQKHLIKKKNIESHIASKKVVSTGIPLKSFCKNYRRKSKQSAVSNGSRFLQSTSKLFCKCPSKCVSGLKDSSVKKIKHLHVVLERLKNSSIRFSNKALNKDVCNIKAGKIYNTKTKQNLPRLLCKKPETLHSTSISSLKPLYNLRQRSCTSLGWIRTQYFKDSAPRPKILSADKKEVSSAIDELSKTQPPRFTSPIKLMFVTEVDGTNGEKYTLSSIYVSPNKNRDDRSLEKTVNCIDNNVQYERTTSENLHCQDTIRTSVQSSDATEHTENSSKSRCLDECAVKRKSGRRKKQCSPVLKQSLKPIGLQKSNATENADKPTELSCYIKLFPLNTNTSKDLLKGGTVNVGRSKVVEEPVEACFNRKCQIQHPSKKLSQYDSEKVRLANKNVVHHSHNIENSLPSETLSKSQSQSEVEISVSSDSISQRGRQVNLTNKFLSSNQSKIIQKNSCRENKKTGHMLDKRSTLNKDGGAKSARLKKYLISRRSIRSKRLSLGVLHSRAFSTTFSYRSALLYKIKKQFFHKFRKTQERETNKLCKSPSRDIPCLNNLDHGDKNLALISDISSENIFRFNTILKWWSTSTSNDSLLKDLDARYEQISNTWVHLNNVENEGETSEPCILTMKMSPVQFLFHKKYDINAISNWFMQSTETQSLSIVKKANARSPVKAKNRGAGPRTKQSKLNCRKRTTKNKLFTELDLSKSTEIISRVTQSAVNKRRTISAINMVKSKDESNVKNQQSVVETSKDACVKLGSSKEAAKETSAALDKVKEKHASISHDLLLPNQNNFNSCSHATQSQSALVSENATCSSPFVKLDRLLRNVQVPKLNKIYKRIIKKDVKCCKVFLKKNSDLNIKKAPTNECAQESISNSTATELSKPHLDIKNSLDQAFFPPEMNCVTKRMPMKTNYFHKKCAKNVCLRKSRRHVHINHSHSKMSTFERRKQCELSFKCGKTNKKRKKCSVVGQMQEDFSKFQFGSLKPVGLRTLRGDSSKIGNYSLTPIRIALHGNTKHDQNIL
ncbi:uncharacterized protein O3C94_014198 [Discoglossus pictus]